MQRRYPFYFIVLMEPFQGGQHIEEYRSRLGMKHAVLNVSGKIWVFIEENVEFSILKDEDQDQELTLKLANQNAGISLLVTLVYAKCRANERLALWDSLVDLSDSYQMPWIIGGDFNVIRTDEEKLGGLPVTFNEIQDFNHCINLCNMEEIQFKGSKFTWWNGRTDEDCIFKRLDRVLCNDRMQNLFQRMEVEHLARSGSDHSPLLIQCRVESEQIVRSFKFLNFWLKEESCMEVIKQSWTSQIEGNPFRVFQQKLKNTKSALAKWSKDQFGNIFQEIGNSYTGRCYQGKREAV